MMEAIHRRKPQTHASLHRADDILHEIQASLLGGQMLAVPNHSEHSFQDGIQPLFQERFRLLRVWTFHETAQGVDRVQEQDHVLSSGGAHGHRRT